MLAPFRLALAALVLWPVLARGEALPEGYPSSYGTLIAASKLEGKLVVYTTVAAAQWKPLLQGFKHRYPWLTAQTLVLAADAMMPRYAEEKAAMGTTGDLLVNASAEAWRELAARQEVLPYDSPEAATLPPEAQPMPGLYVMAIDPVVMLAVPRAVTSVNAAKLLLDYILSPAGQAALAEGGLTPFRRSAGRL